MFGLDGLFSAVGNIAGTLLDTENSLVQQQRQIEHDKSMAGLNQQYNRENMATQNQYQLEQWHRENAYNDPAAVAERYRNAGINPRAVFGQGSANGAGIAGGLSSAPSGSGTMGSASDITFRTNFGGLMNGVPEMMRIRAQNKKDEAEAQKAYEEAKSKSLANAEAEFMKENGAWLEKLSKLKSETSVSASVAYMRKVDADLYDFEHLTDVRNKYISGQKALKEIGKLTAEITRISELNELTSEEKKLVKATADKYRAESAKINTSNTFFDRFGFYPPTGSTLESMLIGIGAKGVGEMADYFKEFASKRKGMKKAQKPKQIVVNPSFAIDYKNAKTKEQKEKVITDYMFRHPGYQLE